MGKRTLTMAVVFFLGCGGVEHTPSPPQGGGSGTPPTTVIPSVSQARPDPPSLAVLLQGPTPTPYTVRPRILNREEVAEAREREYPETLEDSGVGGTVRIWFLLDPEGQVLSRVLDESSGEPELDAAGLRVAQTFRFSPALDGNDPVYLWISLPIRFGGR